MLVNKSKAAELAGVSRRTFYNHISKKGISITTDTDGVEKIDVSELKRVYGHETILKNLKREEDAQSNNGKVEQSAQAFTQNSVQFEKLLLEEKLKGAESLIEQLKAEREQLLEDKKHTQEQLVKALEIGAPIGKLLTDQREVNESRAVADRKVAEESIKREAAEKQVRILKEKLKEARTENESLRNRGVFKRIFG